MAGFRHGPATMNSVITRVINFTTAGVVRFMWLGKITGTNNIPQCPCIIIANHASYLDFLLIGYSLVKIAGIPFQFWAKTKVIKHSVWKKYSDIFGTIEVGKINRMDDLLDLSREALEHGNYICIFPEGTRSRTGDLLPFKQGYLKLASTLGLEVVPVYIENTFYAWPAFKRLPRKRKCDVTFHAPIKIARGMNRSDMDKLNGEIMHMYREYKCWRPCG